MDIVFDASQFSIVFCLCLTAYCLFMGYSMNDKRGGFFLLFGGIFAISLLLGVVSMFGLLWLFMSPAIVGFALKFMVDGIILMFYQDKKKKREY